MERMRMAAVAALLATGIGSAPAQNLIVNPNFGGDTSGWISDAGTTIFFDGNQDANASAGSGAMAMQPTSGFSVSAHQCVAIADGDTFSFGAQVKPNTVISFGMACLAFPVPGCNIDPIGSAAAIVAGPPGEGGWIQLRSESPYVLPAGTQGISCIITGSLQPPARMQQPDGTSTSMWVDNVFFAQGTTPVMLQAFQIE